MTPEAQRIALAEACGWVRGPGGWRNGGEYITQPSEFPDYPNDLNACHEAEKGLDDIRGECRRYVEELERICSRDIAAKGPGCSVSRFGLLHATAAQRCEALLRTLNLWRDDL